MQRLKMLIQLQLGISLVAATLAIDYTFTCIQGNGKTKLKDETWWQGYYKYQCQITKMSGIWYRQINVVACNATVVGGGIIAVGDKQRIGLATLRCKKLPNGGVKVTREMAEPKCQTSGGVKKKGETWWIGDIQHKCVVRGWMAKSIVNACNASKLGMGIIAYGSSKTLNGVTAKCVENEHGKVELQIIKPTCKTGTGEKGKDETWWDGDIQYKCLVTGLEAKPTVNACSASKYGMGILPFGTSKRLNGVTAKCVQNKQGNVELQIIKPTCKTSNGEIHKDETWWVDNIQYKCVVTDGEAKSTVNACNATTLGMGIIAFGSSKKLNGVTAKCIENANGRVELQTIRPKCKTSNGEKQKDETWWVDNIQYKCVVTGGEAKSIVNACNANKLGMGIIGFGSSQKLNGVTAKCIKNANGKVELQTIEPKCKTSDGDKEKDDTWWSDNMQMKCVVSAGGEVKSTVIACDAANVGMGVIAFRSSKTLNGVTAKCITNGNGKVELQTIQPSCKTENGDKLMDETWWAGDVQYKCAVAGRKSKAAAIVSCPAGFTRSQSKSQCYKYDGSKYRSFTENEAYCRSMGAQLPVFRDVNDFKDFEEFMKSKSIRAGVPFAGNYISGKWFVKNVEGDSCEGFVPFSKYQPTWPENRPCVMSLIRRDIVKDEICSTPYRVVCQITGYPVCYAGA